MARSLFAFIAIAVVAALFAAPATAAEKYTRGLRYPSLTPDGKAVVFSYRGDIWVADTDGKSPARRLTIHEAQDTLPRVSPDGKTVAFSSQRNGAYDIFLVPIIGGEAKQISFHSGIEVMADWSKDGKKILFVSNRDASKYRLNVYEMPATGGPARRITKDGGRDPSYSPDGKHIVYARGFNTIYQDNYEGSGNYDLYTIPVEGGLPKPLTKTGGNERYPFYAPDGKHIWFVAEEKGVANFYSIPAEGGKRKALTKYKGVDVHRPDLAWNGKVVVFERWGHLFTTDLAGKDTKAKQLPLVVRGDVRHSGVAQRTVTSGAQHVHVSKDGSSLVFSLHGDIWMTAGSGGKAKRLTSGPFLDEWPRLSPDGTKIAFQSDRSGNSDVWLLDVKSGKTTRATKHKAGDFFHAWRPDGRKLVFCSERSGNREIWDIDLETHETTQLTRHSAADDDPVYSPDGRHIAFDSGREGSQAIYIMDADGKNVRRVTNGGGFLQVPNFSPDGRLISYESFNPGSGRSGGLFVVSASGGPAMSISRDGSTACWSPRGDYIYFTAGNGGNEEIFRVPAPTTVENREKVPFLGTVEVDLRKELANLFEEAWRRLRDGFYDPKMHGVDWNAMKKKYRDMAVDAEDKAEFQNVVMQMLAELNASHLGIYGGRKSSNTVSARVVPTGYLGVELADKPGENGGRKIISVFPKGPADAAGLRVGDEIVGINRKRVKKDTDIDKLLAGTVKKEIRIRFRPISEEGSGDPRNATIEPIGAGTYQKMQYAKWVSDNAGRVKKADRRIGYIHLNAMNPQNLNKFRNTIDNWNRINRRGRGKGIQGLILDVRENGGGNIHQQLMQVLQARPYAAVRARGMPVKVTQPALYWDKPVVVLINERSFSDAEVFPYIFQYAKVGKVIGVPTPGGVIGTNDITLSDGTKLRIPRVGYYGMDGTNLEGHGVKPDIFVEESPEDRAKGRDPQLARAIDEIKAQMKTAKKDAPKTDKPKTDKPKTDKPTTTEPTPDAPKPGAVNTKGTAMDPLADVKPGEWVRYSAALPNSAEKTVMRVTVLEVKDGTVHLERETESGPPLPLPLPTEAPQVPLLEGLSSMGRIVNQETVTEEIDGKNVEVAIITMEAFGGQLRMYFSNAIPCMGLMKVQMGKAVILEAQEWGVEETEEPTPEKAPDEAPKPTPAEKPMEKSAKPGPRPADDVPGPRARAPRNGKGSGLRNPLYDAKVGEWIRLRSIVQGEETIATLRVTEVSEDEVHLESRVAYSGSEIRGAVLKRPRNEFMQMGRRGGRAKVEIGKETVEVKGKSIECITITRTNRRGQVDKRWVSNEVPVNGVVRRERGGKVVQELLDWGTGEPPALPAQGE